jgi:hypothetical protein
MIFYLDGKEYVKSAGDPPLLIQRGRVHGFTTSTYALIARSGWPSIRNQVPTLSLASFRSKILLD